MEISLLTGVHLILTIFDKEEGKIIQYLSDSMTKFTAINMLKNVEVKQKPTKNKNGDESQGGEGNEIFRVESHEPKYVVQNIISEIYTNEHVSDQFLSNIEFFQYDYLFNNGTIPAGFDEDMDDEVSGGEGENSLDEQGVSKPKTAKKVRKEKES